LILVKGGGERGIRTLDGVAPKPHFQLDPEEGSEGFLGSPEALQSICGSTQSSTQKQHRPHRMVEAV
jgi:hypothetical protein